MNVDFFNRTTQVDGMKIQANASKHKAMSYGRMKQESERLKALVREWLELVCVASTLLKLHSAFQWQATPRVA